jgi:predicted alpha/beta-hydrolase family hydrolase
MSREPEKLRINVTETESVTGLLYLAAKPRLGVTVILGHGAGANQMSGFMRQFAAGLADRGLDAVTFNFLYSEKGRGAPDPKARLESCFREVIKAVAGNKKLKGNQLVLGGKSMGGRIASQVAAEGLTTETTTKPSSGKLKKKAETGKDNVAALVFLGYPLHPPGKPDQLRDKHLKDINAPMLFIQGTRDPFGSPEELKEVIKRLRLPATLHLIESGDHSFKVPKSAGPQEKIYEGMMDEISSWTLGKLTR